MNVPTYGSRRWGGSIATAAAIAWLISGVGHAQVLRVPDPRLPRAPDGKPNLTAAAPKTRDGKPDLSGIWHVADAKYLNNLGADAEPPLNPAGAALFRERQAYDAKDRPSGHCLPRGVPASMVVRGRPWKIMQTPNELVMLFDESIHFRQIHTDGRDFPEDRLPTWFGYSIGKWEGDTFVADTLGFVEETWLDNGGHPHSDAMHITERFRRLDLGHLEIQYTIDDPKLYTKPWSVTVRFDLLPDTELSEHVCAAHTPL